LSRFLALLLEAQVTAGRRYQAARERQLKRLRVGLPPGTGGQIDWTRERLHER
jgi:hypothetical protein